MTPWTIALQAPLSFTISQSLLRFMSIESVMPSNHLLLRHPFLFLPLIFPSIRVFSNESALRIKRPKYWNFSFSISPSNEYSGLISLRTDWFDLLAVQGTLKSPLAPQFGSISSLALSFLYGPTLTLYMTTGKTIALTIHTCVSKVCVHDSIFTHVMKKGYFFTSPNICIYVVLEKTLESPLDCKEIQPVHSEGDQSWVFIGRTDAKAETLILWPPLAKS